ncbi:unnamed protein product [Rotaria sordida]|uniref:WWE domain-containing protein n=1 Tax=Rotaria sordida TaxID=392033 RepID=A0A815U5V3_9BILA|nr:unnamed protein product [Rotaria sordida]CAF4193825.1 unnamed protein product [Rotaria sordida]
MDREESVIWSWKSNTDPWSFNQIDQWTPFPTKFNIQLERAYQDHQNELIIDENRKIDLNKFLQIDINDSDKQRPVRRCSKTEDIISYYRRERFNFAQPIRRSITDDTSYYGSSFIIDWLIVFTKGTLKIKSSSIIDALINGILIEGEIFGCSSEARHLTNEIRSIKNTKIEKLQQCCARLYTKPCFLFKIVNETLRDSDQSKSKTLGPFCYLLYNYIGKRHNEYLSLKHQLKQIVKSTKYFTSIIVYRGEQLSLDQIEIYRQAVGKDLYYKWSSFISTSKLREVAEMFGSNVLYIIQIQRMSHNDQYVDVSSIAYIKDEQEILLRPGVRFKIDSCDYDLRTERYIFHIQIVPSFISNIM